MTRRENLSRWALTAAGAILAGTAALHAIGYRPLSQQLAASGVQPAWLAGVKGLWLLFSLHLVLLGALFVAAAVRPDWAGKPILGIAGLVPATDTVLLLGFVGVFVGTVLLGLAALLVFAAVAFRPPLDTAGPGGT